MIFRLMIFRLWAVAAVAWIVFEISTEKILGDWWPWALGEMTCNALWTFTLCENDAIYAASKMLVPPAAAFGVLFGVCWALKGKRGERE
jgi:hypothetical protein